jgi:nitroreductase
VNIYVTRRHGVEIVGLWGGEVLTAPLNGRVFSAVEVGATGPFPAAYLIVSGEIGGDICTARVDGYSTDPLVPATSTATEHDEEMSPMQEDGVPGLAEQRRSVRAYKADARARGAAAAGAGGGAAGALGLQQAALAVHRGARRDDPARAGRGLRARMVLEGPVVIAVCILPGEAWTRAYDGKNYAMVDGALAMDHLMLAATELGLGTCWIGAFDPAAVREILGLPDGVEVVGMTPLGFPDVEAQSARAVAPSAGRDDMKERWG